MFDEPVRPVGPPAPELWVPKRHPWTVASVSTPRGGRHTGYTRMSDLLLRLSYLTLTNVFAFARLLPIGDAEKDVEILADFFETRTLTGARLYVFAVIEQATATWTTSSLRTRAPGGDGTHGQFVFAGTPSLRTRNTPSGVPNAAAFCTRPARGPGEGPGPVHPGGPDTGRAGRPAPGRRPDGPGVDHPPRPSPLLVAGAHRARALPRFGSIHACRPELDGWRYPHRHHAAPGCPRVGGRTPRCT